MSLVNELRDLMQSERTVAGRVVAVSGGVVRVATASGVLEVLGDNLNTGDAVTVQNGMATKKRLDSGGPVFFV